MNRDETIAARYQSVKTDYQWRDEKFEMYRMAYDGDIWSSSPADYETRVTAPICKNMVDLDVSLLMARPPVITVPMSRLDNVDGVQADVIDLLLIDNKRKSDQRLCEEQSDEATPSATRV